MTRRAAQAYARWKTRGVVMRSSTIQASWVAGGVLTITVAGGPDDLAMA